MRLAALEALGTTSTPGGMEVLESLLGSKDEEVTAVAEAALEELITWNQMGAMAGGNAGASDDWP